MITAFILSSGYLSKTISSTSAGPHQQQRINVLLSRKWRWRCRLQCAAVEIAIGSGGLSGKDSTMARWRNSISYPNKHGFIFCTMVRIWFLGIRYCAFSCLIATNTLCSQRPIVFYDLLWGGCHCF
jgi:hypothetical protein